MIALLAVAYWKKGDRSRAFGLVERVLSIARPEGYIRLFVAEGRDMQTMLTEFLSKTRRRAPTKERSLAPYVTSILRAFGPTAPAVPDQAEAAEIACILTGREAEVLRLLPSALSIEGIARELYVTVNTVRTHLKHLYEKIGAHSRPEALARARELGLL